MERGKSPKKEYTIDERGLDYARIANPIYRKMLVKAFAPSHSLIRQALKITSAVAGQPSARGGGDAPTYSH